MPWPLGIATAAALLAGVGAMQTLDRRLPHEHVEAVESSGMQPNVALVVAAIAIHNVPEGLAVGVAAAAGADHGMSLGIAIQNVPEGWIVASAMLALAAAAGAMLWVVSHEMIPASHKPGRIGAGTAGLAAGFAVMTSLASIF